MLRLITFGFAVLLSLPSFAAIPEIMTCRGKDSSGTGVNVAVLDDGSVYAAFAGPGSRPIRGSILDLVPANPSSVREVESFVIAHGLIDRCKVDLKKKEMLCEEMGAKKLKCSTSARSESE